MGKGEQAMTQQNATACDEMVNEVKILVGDQTHNERMDMLTRISSGLLAIACDSINSQDPAESEHERKLAAADNRADFKKGNQP
jgi:hypothetical protein